MDWTHITVNLICIKPFSRQEMNNAMLFITGRFLEATSPYLMLKNDVTVTIS